MAYVQRDKDGKIIGYFAAIQYGYAEEFLDDNNEEVLNYLNPTPTDLQIWSTYQRQAMELLIANDTVAIRCVKANIPYPKEWFDCDIELRAIVHVESGDPSIPLPKQPTTKPEGT